MFFERMNKFRRTIVFRLTLLCVAISAISSLLAFLIFYEVMTSRFHSRIDKILETEMKEVSSMVASRGIGEINAEIANEAETIGTGDVFFRLVSPQGNEIASSNLDSWKGVGVSRIALKDLAEGGPVFETLKPPGWKHNVRVLYGTVGPRMVVQIGWSLKDDEKLFEGIKEVFRIVVVIVLALSSLGGWLMARRGLSGVERLTETVLAISNGAMERRVPLTGRGDEIDRLSGIFNHMLEHIQSLIKEMREIIDNIAHDIKSPIARIRGIAEANLTGEKSSNDYQTMAASTVEECDRLLATVNTMLEVSEIQAGVAALSLREVDISTLVEDACDLFRPLAEDKGLKLEVNTAMECIVHGDRRKLQRVFANLLDNAIKYTPPEGHITVSARKSDKEVIVSVCDTGIGIPSDDIPHVFDRFYRVDKSRSIPGAGLGLSLVQAIIRRHGGEVQVSSSPSFGSTFTVILPQKTTE
jgi:heavy metal sensor kinase